MGSAKVSNAKPQQITAMADKDKKNVCKAIFRKLFQKDKKKEKVTKDEKKKCPITSITDNLEKLAIEKPKDTEREKDKSKDDTVNLKPEIKTGSALLASVRNREKRKEESDNSDEDESELFSVKVIENNEEEKRSLCYDSQLSGDSGLGLENDTDTKEVSNILKKLTIDDEKEERTDNDKKEEKQKEKKMTKHTVLMSRGKFKVNKIDAPRLHPYENGRTEITHVHTQSFTGGHVTVNQNSHTDTDLQKMYRDLDTYIVKNTANYNQLSQEEQELELMSVLEIIQKDAPEASTQNPGVQTFDSLTPESNILSGFDYLEAETAVQPETYVPVIQEPSDPIKEFSTMNYINESENEILDLFYELPDYPTPPSSGNIASPNSTLGSPRSFCPTNSEYLSSPERSSPFYNSDHETYQDLSVDDMNLADQISGRPRTTSNSSMNMKQFKDMQKEISNSFSKKECCQSNRKTCRQIFLEHFHKLPVDERKGLCLKISKMDMNNAPGVLLQIIKNVAGSSQISDIQFSIFSLICQRILEKDPSFFLASTGASLISWTALSCAHCPLLTRYVALCVLTARKCTHHVVNDNVFHEVDALGDNLVIACARAGDSHAAVLGELLAAQPPLFNVHHANADGYTALHVACKEHSDTSSRLHTLHVLLEHGHADIWKGDIKGGDTALHLAVNSANCDLQVIMCIFKNVDRKQWKKLAHLPNRSSVTPLEYARAKNKQNYPQEVLNFLKKCR